MHIKVIILASCLSLSVLQSADIFKAIELNDKKVIQKWLKHECNTKAVNSQGQTVVIAAVHADNRGLVKKFLKKGVFINAVDSCGKTALDYAVELSRKKIVPILFQNGAKVTSEENLYKVYAIFKHKSNVFKGVGLGLDLLCLPIKVLCASSSSQSSDDRSSGKSSEEDYWGNEATKIKDHLQKGYVLEKDYILAR